MELHGFAAGPHELVCHMGIGNGKIELVGLDGTGLAALVAGLDEAAFVGFENEALSYKEIQLTGFYAIAKFVVVPVAEASAQAYHDNGYNDEEKFTHVLFF